MQTSANQTGCNSWKGLRERVLQRDGNKCRNCASEKYIEVHHWHPLPEEGGGIDQKGYRIRGGDYRIVPESGLITLCQICHNALHQARRTVRVSENSTLLGPVSVPEGEWHNIFQLWALSERELPLKVVRQSWNQATDHYYLVERIEIRKWPYGFAWGHYYRDGKAGEKQKIGSAGSFEWRILT